MSDKWIRASEISDYVYCGRAWYLRRGRGYTADNPQQLNAGTRHHQEHGRNLQLSIWLQRIAYAILFIVVALITFQVLAGFSGGGG